MHRHKNQHISDCFYSVSYLYAWRDADTSDDWLVAERKRSGEASWSHLSLPFNQLILSPYDDRLFQVHVLNHRSPRLNSCPVASWLYYLFVFDSITDDGAINAATVLLHFDRFFSYVA